MFRLIVKDGDEKPFADTRFTLKIDVEVYEGVTDGTEKIER